MTLLLTHEDCLRHETPRGHPESADRVEAVLNHFESVGLINEVNVVEPDLVDLDLIARVHSAQYVDALVEVSPSQGLVRLDADTSMGPNSLNAARRAAGAAVTAVRQVISTEEKRAFCAVRPPGHHAESSTVMGFCLFNSIAVAADVALDSVDRVAILDFDVHHGNGTVEIFADRPEVLVCSSFQYPFYPYRNQEVDRENIVNTPLEAGTTGSQFRAAIERSWLGPIEQHRPQLILVSAGFDAHKDDPLAQLELEDTDYEWISNLIVDLANTYCDGRVVSTLEGGYDLGALARSAAVHLRCLL